MYQHYLNKGNIWPIFQRKSILVQLNMKITDILGITIQKDLSLNPIKFKHISMEDWIMVEWPFNNRTIMFSTWKILLPHFFNYYNIWDIALEEALHARMKTFFICFEEKSSLKEETMGIDANFPTIVKPPPPWHW